MMLGGGGGTIDMGGREHGSPQCPTKDRSIEALASKDLERKPAKKTKACMWVRYTPPPPPGGGGGGGGGGWFLVL
jgi:hypothetical protein